MPPSFSRFTVRQDCPEKSTQCELERLFVAELCKVLLDRFLQTTRRLFGGKSKEKSSFCEIFLRDSIETFLKINLGNPVRRRFHNSGAGSNNFRRNGNFIRLIRKKIFNVRSDWFCGETI